jgi:hypothetical protein
MNLEDKRTKLLAVLRFFTTQPLGRVCAAVPRPGSNTPISTEMESFKCMHKIKRALS